MSLDNNVKRRTSSYFNVKTDRVHVDNGILTSLNGVGKNDKSHSPKSSRPSIKIYPEKFMVGISIF